MENKLTIYLTSSEKELIRIVTDSLPSENSRRSYGQHLQNFFAWLRYQGNPELNKALINSYVRKLESDAHSASSINQKLSAIRKLASEAEDNNLIDSKTANVIRSVKGVPKKGVRLGNWLTLEEAQMWLNAPNTKINIGWRDKAILSTLIGCGLRRTEIATLSIKQIQIREGRPVIVDLTGKGDKIRSIPMPSWTKRDIDKWLEVGRISDGFIFRRIYKFGRVGDNLTDDGIYKIIKKYSLQLQKQGIAPHDLRRTFAKLTYKGGASLDQIQLSLGHESIQTTERYLGVEQSLTDAPCDYLDLE